MKWFWFPLIAMLLNCAAHAQVPRWVRTGHEGGVFYLAFTPDGKHFISAATADSRILVWNTPTGDFERAMSIPGSQPFNYYSYGRRYASVLALAPDGRTLAIGGDSVIYLIDFASGTVIDSIVPFSGQVVLLQFSASGDTLAWFGSGVFCRFQRSMRKIIDTLPASSYPSSPPYISERPSSYSLSADTKKFAYFSSSDTIALVTLSRKPDTARFYLPYAQQIALNADGSLLAVDGEAIINTSTGQPVFTLPGSESMPGRAGSLYFLGASDTLLLFSDSAFALEWPDESGLEVFQLKPTSKDEYTFFSALSPDRSAYLDSRFIEVAPALIPVAGAFTIFREPAFIGTDVNGSCGMVTQVRWSPTSDTVTASDFGGNISSYDGTNGFAVSYSGPGQSRIGGFDYFPNGDSIIFSSFYDDDFELGGDGIWTPSGELADFSNPGTAQFFTGLSLSPNGLHIILGEIFDTLTRRVPFDLIHTHVNSFAFFPDGSILLVEDTFGHLATMSTSTMAITELNDPDHSAILGGTFSPDGAEIAVMQGDNSVEILSYPSDTEIYRLHGHTGTLTGAMFSHNGRYLISSSNDSTMKVWDMASGKAFYTYSYPSPLVTAGFSHDSKYVAASDGATSVIVWDAPPNLGVGASPGVSASMELTQNFPNPVSTQTSFSFTLPNSEEVTIGLYDVMGREVRILANGRFDAGTHWISLAPEDISGLVPGVYYYRIESALGAAERHMVVR